MAEQREWLQPRRKDNPSQTVVSPSWAPARREPALSLPKGICFPVSRRIISIRHDFYDFNVWTEKKRIEKLRCIHRNPVGRGLVESPEQWRWSSFRWYLSGEVGRVKINDTEILVMKIRPPGA